MPRDPWRVAALAYEDLCTFEFGIVVELFGLCRPEFDPWYTLRVCAERPGSVRATGGVRVEVAHGLRALDHAGTIVIPGWRGADAAVPPALVNKLRRAHDAGARLLSVCSGVFVLAATGLLDGRRATTHWRYADALAEQYPRISVDPDVLYVDEGQLLTSAGSAAGIDMGLHLIARDAGAAVANAVAKRLVVPSHRAGGQKQFIDAPVSVDPAEEGLGRLLEELRATLTRPHTAASMARHLHVSPRTFARRFKAATGTTPHRWLIRERVLFAQTLLETTELPVDDLARRTGFSDTQLLRLHFRRAVGTSPSAYRSSFRAAARRA